MKNVHLVFFTIVIFLISFKAFSTSDDRTKILDHLKSLKYFSASFLQNDGESISEGKVYIGKERIRAEYFSPTKILIILDENKAMYYNYELEEDEFFNPNNTNAWFLYEIFRNPIFFLDSELEVENNEIIINKNGYDNEGRKYLIKVKFEKSPIVIRGVEVLINEDLLKLSIFNHNYNEEFDKNFFKLISPKLLN